MDATDPDAIEEEDHGTADDQRQATGNDPEEDLVEVHVHIPDGWPVSEQAPLMLRLDGTSQAR